MPSVPNPFPSQAKRALEHCCSSLTACSSGQRDALFTAREALVEFATHLTGSTTRYRHLCEAIQRMLGQLLRRNSLSESEALDMARAIMGFVRGELLDPLALPTTTPPSADSQQARPNVPGFTGRTIPTLSSSDPFFAPPALSATATRPRIYSLPQGPAAAPPQAAAPDPELQSAARFVNESRLGEILCTLGMITHEQLDRALVLQRVAKRRLGEVLVIMQAITQEQLHAALEHQRTVTLALTEGQGRAMLPSYDQKRHQ